MRIRPLLLLILLLAAACARPLPAAQRPAPEAPAPPPVGPPRAPSPRPIATVGPDLTLFGIDEGLRKGRVLAETGATWERVVRPWSAVQSGGPDDFGGLGHALPADVLEAGVSSEDGPIYGYLVWDAVELHLSAIDALDPKTNTSVCYPFVDDADAVYAAWSAARVEGRFRAPADTTYGRREFGYVDPHGNLLRVGSALTR